MTELLSAKPVSAPSVTRQLSRLWRNRRPSSPSDPLLPRIAGPQDLRLLNHHQLTALAAEIRTFLITNVTATGGHLGANLGTVELTLALHRVFESPVDRLLFDTGHQSYTHKLLTGRQDGFGRLRQHGGMSGYPSRTESEHDVIENSHASTALSWADGLAKANELTGRPGHVVAVIGDGAMTGGMAWEALNNIAAAPHRPVVIVLNDNERSYTPTVGGFAEHLGHLRHHHRGTNVFTNLGLGYIGPIDGHDVSALESALRQARWIHGPVVVHCLTRKGHGWAPAEQNEADRMHACGVVDAITGRPRTVSDRPTWTSVFGAELVSIAARRPDVVGITAAMLHPVGLDRMAEAYPSRVFDVGIAEQHAATSAAGLALGGLHPVVAIYATFLNRAFDQVLMDVALHRQGVTFVLDRAGVTGDDGASHNGMWDLSMLQLVPGLRIAAPRDGARLRRQLREAVAVDDAPTVIRFPKGELGPDIPAVAEVGEIDVLRLSERTDTLIVAVGATAGLCLQAAEELDATVIDPGWVKPVDPALLGLAAGHRLVVVVEDGGETGGVGAAIAQELRRARIDVPVRTIGIPQRFLHHGSRGRVLADVGLTAAAITETVSHHFAEGALA